MKKIIMSLMVISLQTFVASSGFAQSEECQQGNHVSPQQITVPYKTKRMCWDYQLEKMDKHHRYGGKLIEEYDNFRGLAKNIADWNKRHHFFNWLNQQETSSTIPHVQYYSEDKKAEKHFYFVGNKGQFTHSDKNPFQINTDYMFIMDSQGNFYLELKDRGLKTLKAVHHSSLSAGESVAGAGTMEFNSKGNLALVSDSSGHYCPGDILSLNVLHSLHSQGVDLGKVILELVDHDETFNAGKWFHDRMSGNAPINPEKED